MKIIFFFLMLLPTSVFASSIKSVEVLNGTLSREFESTNNIYSVTLNDDATSLMMNCETESGITINIYNNEYIVGEENKVIYEAVNEEGKKEEYVFYLEKDITTPVFATNYEEDEKEKIIPHLKWYVISGIVFINLLLFKIIVLGFKR